ncbi:hypothetical protein KP509_13G007400 [Ceratopteris richardii]|nr:hypothetical protein KP509_13G007400 [Ceratopteris richardii]
MQVTLKMHNKVSDYSERAVESNNLLQCEPFPLYGDRQSSTSSRHLSKSSGSRSNPSRSSIPGLRSKYSKPDPKAKLPKKCERPPYILPNFEEPNGRSNKSLFNGNNSISITPLDLVDVAQETDDEVDLYWCELDQGDDQENDLPASIDSVSTCETARPLQSQPLSPLPSTRTATPRSFEYSRKQTQESQEWTAFDCSDSDDEINLNMEDSDCSDSDDEINLNMEDSDLIIDSITTCEVARPLQCQSLSPVHSNRIDTSRSFVYARQTKDFPEWTEFEWSESDEELSPSTKESYLIKSSTSGQKKFLEEKNSLDSVARGGHDKENVNLSLKASSILLSERKHKDSLPKGQSLQPSFWYNRKECEYVNNTSYELFLEENKILTYNELQSLPASVKFLEIPAWKSQIYPNIPFQLQYSYSEVPKAMILGFRDHFSPFGPGTMDRPWTGRPLIKPRRHMDYLKPFDPVLERVKSFELSFNRKLQFTKRVKTREQIQGRPLTEDEVKVLVQNCHAEKSQVNLGRDGLTHNMIHLIHNHWKKHPVCRIKCRGPPTLDMDNLCFHIEDKTGGHIIYRTGCILYVFRGRHYSYKLRPLLPYMLYKPSSPVYPKLVPQAPRGLTIEQARQLRIIGQKVKPLMKLRNYSTIFMLVFGIF